MIQEQSHPIPLEDCMALFAQMGMRAVLEGGDEGTIAELLAFFHDDTARSRVCERVATPEVAGFWS